MRRLLYNLKQYFSNIHNSDQQMLTIFIYVIKTYNFSVSTTWTKQMQRFLYNLKQYFSYIHNFDQQMHTIISYVIQVSVSAI